MTDENDNDIQDEKLRRALAALPREIRPERDLWPEIATRIAPRRRQYWPAAAAIALVAVGAIVASIVFTRPAANPGVAAIPTARKSAPVTMPQTVRARTLAASIRKSTRLDPKTQAVLLRNLAIIENSLDNIRRALRDDPNNPGLQGLLYQMYRNEAALLNAAQRVQLQTSTGVVI